MERKWIVAAFLDISGFRSWTYRAATPPEAKEEFLREFYTVLERYVLNHPDRWSKYEGDAIITAKEFTKDERKSSKNIFNYVSSLRDLLKETQDVIAKCECPPPGVRIRIMEGYAYKFMVLDPNDPCRKRRIPEYVEYCTNTLRGFLGVNPEHPCLATGGVVKNMGKAGSVFRVRSLESPSHYPKGVNREDVDGLKILKF